VAAQLIITGGGGMWQVYLNYAQPLPAVCMVGLGEEGTGTAAAAPPRCFIMSWGLRMIALLHKPFVVEWSLDNFLAPACLAHGHKGTECLPIRQ
jgi:hypothetical protein